MYFMASSPNHFRVVDEQFKFRKGAAVTREMLKMTKLNIDQLKEA
ncbi:MAG: hypothetical protein ABWX61_09415 [Paenisporosarcina sp.]